MRIGYKEFIKNPVKCMERLQRYYSKPVPDIKELVNDSARLQSLIRKNGYVLTDDGKIVRIK